MSENAKEWIKDIVCAVIIAVIILQFIMPTVVKEHSMENTFHEGDYLFVSKMSYKLGKDPVYGDVIVFQSDIVNQDNGSRKLLIKRVIGVPGDTISIDGQTVYLNGKALDEPYTKDGVTYTHLDEVTVPEGCLFVMGDNRQNSADSRDMINVGFVEMNRVKGKVFLRLFPFNQIGGVYKNIDKNINK